MRKLADLPNQEGYEFFAVYPGNKLRIQKVIIVNGIHTTENFKELIGWKPIRL